MQITLNDARLIGGGIGSPGKKNLLTATFEAEFGPRTAKALDCQELLVNGSASLHVFSLHKLKTNIPVAHVGFQLPGQKKTHEFPCRASDFEVQQKKENIGTLRCKLTFEGPDNKLKAFNMLYAAEEGPTAFARVEIAGAQGELFANDDVQEPSEE